MEGIMASDKKKIAVSDKMEVAIFISPTSAKTVQVELRKLNRGHVTAKVTLTQVGYTKLQDKLPQALTVGRFIAKDVLQKGRDVFMSTNIELTPYTGLFFCTYSQGVYLSIETDLGGRGKSGVFTLDLSHWCKLNANRHLIDLEVTRVQDYLMQMTAKKLAEVQDVPLISLFKYVCVSDDGTVMETAPFWMCDKEATMREGKTQLSCMAGGTLMHIIHRLVAAPGYQVLVNVAAGTLERYSRDTDDIKDGKISVTLNFGIGGVVLDMARILRLPQPDLATLRVNTFTDEDLAIIDIVSMYPEKAIPSDINLLTELIHLARAIVHNN